MKDRRTKTTINTPIYLLWIESEHQHDWIEIYRTHHYKDIVIMLETLLATVRSHRRFNQFFHLDVIDKTYDPSRIARYARPLDWLNIQKSIT